MAFYRRGSSLCVLPISNQLAGTRGRAFPVPAPLQWNFQGCLSGSIFNGVLMPCEDGAVIRWPFNLGFMLSVFQCDFDFNDVLYGIEFIFGVFTGLK